MMKRIREQATKDEMRKKEAEQKKKDFLAAKEEFRLAEDQVANAHCSNKYYCRIIT
jgi:hypothetical protein